MEGWDWWDLGLLAAATYLAATALVRLMLAYRDAKIAEVRRLFEEHQRKNESQTRRDSSGATRKAA